jgi:hypothetical protein
MKRIVGASALLALLVVAGVAWAKNTRIEINEDFGPPTWHDFQSFGLIEGELFAIHDDEWAAIIFWRPPEDIPSGFDLLGGFDGSVFDSELLIKGYVIVDDDGNVPFAQVQGLGAVPVWFVPWDDLQAAAADDVLTIDELLALDPLKGIADSFVEENHVYGVHPKSHLTTEASGTLEDGTSFELRAVEVDLELKQVQIDFE